MRELSQVKKKEEQRAAKKREVSTSAYDPRPSARATASFLEEARQGISLCSRSQDVVYPFVCTLAGVREQGLARYRGETKHGPSYLCHTRGIMHSAERGQTPQNAEINPPNRLHVLHGHTNT